MAIQHKKPLISCYGVAWEQFRHDTQWSGSVCGSSKISVMFQAYGSPKVANACPTWI